mmetsp:Transcript_3886/g.9002  ORF Transcript_3886/g.9002 Transcript_3886/m.9002 type:complete len:211 (+) Transcript_3886:92-724(+)
MRLDSSLALATAIASFLPASAFLPSPITSQFIYILRSKYTGILRATPSNSSSEFEPETLFPEKQSIDFIRSANAVSDIDSSNIPPNLQTILTSFEELKSGSDLRGVYVPHKHSGGTIANISLLVKDLKRDGGGAALTPFASHCLGAAFAKKLVRDGNFMEGDNIELITICVGTDPRPHGERLADTFARGAESVEGVKVLYTGFAGTPSLY